MSLLPLTLITISNKAQASARSVNSQASAPILSAMRRVGFIPTYRNMNPYNTSQVNTQSQVYAKLKLGDPDVDVGMRVEFVMHGKTLTGEIKDVQYRTLTFNNEDREVYIKLDQ